MKESKTQIELFETEEIGIIISFASGVFYSNQVGGYSNLHFSYQGIYASLHNFAFTIEKQFNTYFTGKKWKGHCSDGIDEEDADFIDNLLQDSYTTKFLKVDQNKLKDSCEAWIYVKGVRPKEEIPIIKGFEDFEAVLTWQNSD